MSQIGKRLCLVMNPGLFWGQMITVCGCGCALVYAFAIEGLSMTSCTVSFTSSSEWKSYLGFTRDVWVGIAMEIRYRLPSIKKTFAPIVPTNQCSP
ncbi:hypothetical protein TNCV_2747831 [Trichonephila clavipes]|nr:hypothetical protein TNCV_2747831 [Trichonephila clavipes]